MCLSDFFFGGGADTRNCVLKFIALVEEEWALWDKNEVARAWKKFNQMLKNFAIKSRRVNHFVAEKSHDLGTNLPRSLGQFLNPEKSHSVNPHYKSRVEVIY